MNIFYHLFLFWIFITFLRNPGLPAGSPIIQMLCGAKEHAIGFYFHVVEVWSKPVGVSTC